MKYKPHDYQKFTTDFILSHPIAAVILQMGLGKTVCTLTAIEELIYNRFEIGKALIVAPLRVSKVTWSDEIQKWDHLSHLTYSIAVGSEKERVQALKQDVDIHIINRENLQWLIEKSKMPFEYDMRSAVLPAASFETPIIRPGIERLNSSFAAKNAACGPP